METSLFILGSLLFASLVWAIAQVVGSQRRAVLIAFAAFVCLLIALPMGFHWRFYFKPNQRDLQRYRQNVQLVVTNFGGWVAFRAEADRLLAEHGYSPHGQIIVSNGLPIINLLAPKRTEIHPLANGSAFIKFQISGTRSTGGRGKPYYCLIVSTRDLLAEDIEVGLNLHAITNRIWEAY